MALVQKTVDTGGGGDYISLTTWNIGEATDLITDTDQHKVTLQASGDAADTTTLNIGGDWTSSVTYYLLIMADEGEEAIKTGYSETRYRLEVDDDRCIDLTPFGGNHHITFSGLQIRRTYTSVDWEISVGLAGFTAGDIIQFINCRIEVENLKIWAIDSSDADVTLNIYTSIIGGTSSISKCIRGIDMAGTLNIYNCVVAHCDDYGIGIDSGSILNCRNNCILTDNDINDSGGTLDIQFNCATDDLDTEFTESNNVQPDSGDWDNELNDSDNGDYTLVAGGNCENGGVNDPSSGAYTTDIDGDAYTSPWSIGHDTFVVVVSGVILIIPVIQHHRQQQGEI